MNDPVGMESDSLTSSLESRITGVMRSRIAGLIGLAVGLITVAFLLLALAHAISRGRTLLGDQTVTSVVVSAIGFGVFQVCAVLSLDVLTDQIGADLWSASQLAKYFPAPGASLGGMMHSSVRRGLAPREALALTVRHSGILLGTSLIVGAWSVASAVHRNTAFPEWPTVLGIVLLACLVLLVSTRGITLSQSWRSVGLAIAGWVALGLLLWLGIGRSHSPGLAIVSSFSAAWAIGFVVLPVPAGIGIREAALLFLLKPWLGQGGAASFAVLSRLLQIGSDGILVAGNAFFRRRRRNAQ